MVHSRLARLELALAASLLLLSACSSSGSASSGGGGGTTGAPPPDTSAASQTGGSGSAAATGATTDSSLSGTTESAGGQQFKGQTLTVASWQSYGADDPWALKEFEAQTGATVKNVYYTSEDGMLQMLKQGGLGSIDVLLPNLQYVDPAASQGLIQPIDQSKITTWGELEPTFTKLDSIRYKGDLYAVPWVQGATSLAVNPDAVSGEVDSWSILWDPSSKGKVAFFDDPTTAVMTAALYLGEDPQHPDLDKVRATLEDLKKNVKLFWSSADDWNKPYLSGAITMGNLWSGLAGTLNANGHAVKYVFPKEGTIIWGDTWAIAKDAPHPDLAYAWINFLTSEQYFKHWIGEPGPNQQLAVPVNGAAVNALSATDQDKLSAKALINYKGKAAFQAGVSLDQLKEWTQLWEEVKAG